MDDAKLKRIGDLYNAIGNELASIVGNPDGTFLYVEAGEGWIDTSVFRDEGFQIRYYDANKRLTDLLLEVWEAEDPDKRWAAMEYTIIGTKFQVEFVFPENFGADLSINDRRELVLNARYGATPRVYPPIPSTAERLRQLQAEDETGTKRH